MIHQELAGRKDEFVSNGIRFSNPKFVDGFIVCLFDVGVGSDGRACVVGCDCVAGSFGVDISAIFPFGVGTCCFAGSKFCIFEELGADGFDKVSDGAKILLTGEAVVGFVVVQSGVGLRVGDSEGPGNPNMSKISIKFACRSSSLVTSKPEQPGE